MKTVLRWIGFACIAGASALMAAGCGDGVCSDANCACESGDDCEFECPQGGCAQSCSGDSVCTATCEGGGCSQGCQGSADCTFSCNGGSCTQSCLGSTGTCTASCSGGACTSDLGGW